MNFKELADQPYLVLPIYICVILPLLLYVYHDILDKRWRHVSDLSFFLVAYSILYSVCGSGVIFYIVVQIGAGDFKEVGASIVTILIGSYEASKLVRLMRILKKHRELVDCLNQIDRTLARMAGVEPLGLHYKIFHSPEIELPENSRYNREQARDDADRHLMLSTTIFDDDFPGDAMRIRWLTFLCTRRIEVIDDDADSAAARLGLWIRLVLRRPESEPWRLATSSSPLITGHKYRASLGTALRRLVQYGVAPEFEPPIHYERNPVEALLNRDANSQVGVGFFWTATFMSHEEVAQALAEMHPRWLRALRQNGKSLMWETSMSFILDDFRENEQSESLRTLLKIPVLSWSHDIANYDIWKCIADVCTDAVLSLLPKSYGQQQDASPSTVVRFNPSVQLENTQEMIPLTSVPSGNTSRSAFSSGDVDSTAAIRQNIAQTVHTSIMFLRESTRLLGGSSERSQETAEDNRPVFEPQGVAIGLTLLELIRASARSGFIAEQVLGPDFYMNTIGEDCPGLLCKADIVTGVAATLIELGMDKCVKMETKLERLRNRWGLSDSVSDVIEAHRECARKKGSSPHSTNQKADSEFWMLGQVEGRCKHPESAFGALLKSGKLLAGCVHDMCESYLRLKPMLCLKNQHAPLTSSMQKNWLRWKMQQISELSRHGKVLLDSAGKQLRMRPSTDRKSSLDIP